MHVTSPNNQRLMFHVDHAHDVTHIKLWLNRMLGILHQEHDKHYLVIPDAWDMQAYHVVILISQAALSLHMEFACAWQVFWCGEFPMCTNECELTA